ncbi:hypothetical protein BaRGS_00014288 [Batillaria attramentaria]|uniref:Uncharacterized protein n=1 Tax=Batillaria attramentaria TaxID=370345 RepID=A0ABD0L4F2_9CAEN
MHVQGVASVLRGQPVADDGRTDAQGLLSNPPCACCGNRQSWKRAVDVAARIALIRSPYTARSASFSCCTCSSLSRS